ncbi:MAG: D-alanyl-D-alanine carboxypeptidase family protein [Stappiaceae bacterium]
MKFLLTCLVALTLTGCVGAKLPPLPEDDVDVSQTTFSYAAPVGRATAKAYSAIVVNAKSGRILHEENAGDLRFPASLTKMMTLYLLFDEISAGRLSFSDTLEVSKNAASQPPAKIGLKEGTTFTVLQAAQAMAVKSGNDVAMAVAENLAGSEAAFASRMNRKAASLGLTRTHFVNASGLPDSGQVTTARDMAILGRALKTRHARYSRFFKATEFVYNGKKFRATNRLLGKVRGVDGIKTGYIRLSGYNLAASVNRGGKRLIVVVMGAPSGKERNEEVTRLIEEYL